MMGKPPTSIASGPAYISWGAGESELCLERDGFDGEQSAGSSAGDPAACGRTGEQVLLGNGPGGGEGRVTTSALMMMDFVVEVSVAVHV
jgi:hypothetical protein